MILKIIKKVRSMKVPTSAMVSALVVVIGAILAFWLNTKVELSNHEIRINSLEKVQEATADELKSVNNSLQVIIGKLDAWREHKKK